MLYKVISWNLCYECMRISVDDLHFGYKIRNPTVILCKTECEKSGLPSCRKNAALTLISHISKYGLFDFICFQEASKADELLQIIRDSDKLIKMEMLHSREHNEESVTLYNADKFVPRYAIVGNVGDRIYGKGRAYQILFFDTIDNPSKCIIVINAHYPHRRVDISEFVNYDFGHSGPKILNLGTNVHMEKMESDPVGFELYISAQHDIDCIILGDFNDHKFDYWKYGIKPFAGNSFESFGDKLTKIRLSCNKLPPVTVGKSYGDYVLIDKSKAVFIVESTVTNENIVAPASDHFPVFAEIKSR